MKGDCKARTFQGQGFYQVTIQQIYLVAILLTFGFGLSKLNDIGDYRLFLKYNYHYVNKPKNNWDSFVCDISGKSFPNVRWSVREHTKLKQLLVMLPLLNWEHCWDIPGKLHPWSHCQWIWMLYHFLQPQQFCTCTWDRPSSLIYHMTWNNQFNCNTNVSSTLVADCLLLYTQ